MRVLVAALLVAVLVLGGLYAFGLPPFGPREPAPPPVPAIFPVIESGDAAPKSGPGQWACQDWYSRSDYPPGTQLLDRTG